MAQNRLFDEMACNCLMGRTRLLSRVITGVYEEQLTPFGLKASQLNLLVVIAQEGPIRRAEIGRLIQLDASTLTRNLQVMLTNGWIDSARDHADGRGSPLQITNKGKALLVELAPAWRKAQRRARELLGADGAATLMTVSNALMGTGTG